MTSTAQFERLPFQLPEFQRTVWVSQAARDYWEPKIQAINRMWPRFERTTVIEGLRPGALQTVTPDQLLDLQHWCQYRQLPMTLVAMEGVGGAGNAAVPYQPGAPFTYRVYLGHNPDQFLHAWSDGDNAAIGAALGFPPCCTAFFDRYWRKEGWRDLTYPALLPEVENPRYTNVLLRWLGVRPIFHLPCSMTCEASDTLGRQIATLLVQIPGYELEEDWLHTLLSMPMGWTSLHGVAMVVTPIFKLVYASDPLPTKATLRLPSAAYPVYGARGNTFPFETVTPVPVPLVMKKPYLNGFTSREAMQRGHQFVLDMLPADLHGSVLDLGCGDGALLRAILWRHPYTELHGVEQRTDVRHRYDVGDLFTWQWDRDYRLVLLAIQRLEETEPATVLRLLSNIADHTETLLLYSYDGWRTDVSDLIRQRFSARKHTHDRDANFAASLYEPLGRLHGRELHAHDA